MLDKVEFYEDGSIKSIQMTDLSVRDTAFWLRFVSQWGSDRKQALKMLSDRIASTESARNG